MKFYNQKVIRTGPYVEIWTYSKPIITHSDEVTISNETLNEKNIVVILKIFHWRNKKIV